MTLQEAKDAFLDATSNLRAARLTATRAVDLMRAAVEAEVHADQAHKQAQAAYNTAVFAAARVARQESA